MLHFLLSFCASNRDKMTKSPTSKQHPYSSHISKFAMFPSFYPPGDPEPGVRASSRPFFNSDMSVLKKTKGKKATFCDKRSKIRHFFGRCWGLSLTGNSYRHEILESPTKTSKRAVIELGEYGSFPVSKVSYHLWSSETFVLVTFYSSTQSIWKDRSRCFTPPLQRLGFPTLNSMTGTCPPHCLSGHVTCWKIWRGLGGSPPTSCSTQVKMQKTELQIRKQGGATILHPPFRVG